MALHVERAVGDQGEDADQGERLGAAAAAHEAAIVTVLLWIVLGGVTMSAIALVVRAPRHRDHQDRAIVTTGIAAS